METLCISNICKMAMNSANNQLLCYRPSSEKWKNKRCFGAIATARGGHATTVIEDKVWLYSGQSPTAPATDFNDLYQLDMHSRTWSEINTGQTNPRRCFKCSLNAATENQLVLHGGENWKKNNTWILDLPSLSWRRLYSTKYKDHPRFNHTGCQGINKSIIIAGGHTNATSQQSYCSIFNVMLEPKSLQQLAIKTIYAHRTELPWKCHLPKKLMRLLLIDGHTATGELVRP